MPSKSLVINIFSNLPLQTGNAFFYKKKKRGGEEVNNRK
jgi:hypothetical protein